MAIPISPQEIVDSKRKIIPDVIIDAFNIEIAKCYSDGKSVVNQESVVSRAVSLGLILHEIFDNNWLNIEELYEERGWNVVYEKPGYNESGATTFTFYSISWTGKER